MDFECHCMNICETIIFSQIVKEEGIRDNYFVNSPQITRHSARASGLEREMFTTRGRDSSQQTGSQNILTNTKYDGDIHQTNDTLISSLKVHHELNKLRSQTSQRRTSLEDLLKRTEAELKDLNVTEVSGFVDDNVSVLSGVSNLSSNYQ